MSRNTLNSDRRRRLLIRLFEKQEGRCCYCQTRLELEAKEGLRVATLEHIKPVAKGGSNGIKNLAMACSTCNSLKGDMSVQDFLDRYPFLIKSTMEFVKNARLLRPQRLWWQRRTKRSRTPSVE